MKKRLFFVLKRIMVLTLFLLLGYALVLGFLGSKNARVLSSLYHSLSTPKAQDTAVLSKTINKKEPSSPLDSAALRVASASPSAPSANAPTPNVRRAFSLPAIAAAVPDTRAAIAIPTPSAVILTQAGDANTSSDAGAGTFPMPTSTTLSTTTITMPFGPTTTLQLPVPEPPPLPVLSPFFVPSLPSTPTFSPPDIPTTSPPAIPSPGVTEGENMIPNPTLEAAAGTAAAPDGWLTDTITVPNAAYTYPVTGKSSPSAVQVSIPQSASFMTGPGTDAKWYFQPIAVQGGETFTFSDFYMSDIPTHMTAQFQSASGTFSWTDIANVPPASDWQQASGTFTVPAGTTSLTVYHLINAPGTLTTDDYILRRVGGEGTFPSPPVSETPPDEPTPPPPSPEEPVIPPPDSGASTSTSSTSTAGEPPISSPSSQPSGGGMVSLDFDDGWRSAYTGGVPILEAANLPATFYIISRVLGQENYMTAAEVSELQAKGFEIGAHTRTHPHLPTLTAAEMQNEIAGSKADLEALGVHSVTSFAYPYGENNTDTDQIVRESGFASARTVETGFNAAGTNRFLLKTQNVDNGATPAQAIGWINEAMANNEWLILVFHQVDDTIQDPYNLPTADLREIVDYLVQNHIPVVTNAQALQTMAGR